ncbi:unnamed protein product [Mycena citricolor]|uniref:Peroxisomal ATPase PEX1 n=1 Tax=Mycena citricolor TaxID=2018698 RepID=A0AAD2Q6J7_9AGAR|nr:unnamed protein product [Mycena citricolor]
MPRRARVHYVSLKSSLVNLPISIYGPLVERSIRPQHLAVHLTVVSQEKLQVYVGWTGMASASSLAQFNTSDPSEKGLETVEIDPQYALGLGIKQNDIVEIGLVHDLSMATSVATEPLTSDDWEIIEIHASHVESTLLSQVRVAKVGQEIDVWVLGRTRVRLRVVSIVPESKGNALLLTTNTEVSIAPKLHSKKASANGTPVREPAATSQNANESKPNAAAVVAPQILRVLAPGLINAAIPGAEEFGLVSPESFAILHPTATDDGTTYYKALLKRLSPPVDPLAAEENRELAAAPVDVFVRPDKQVPRGQIICRAAQDCGRVCLSRPPETDTMQSTEGPAELTRDAPPKISLAGVDDVFLECSQFCRRMLAMHWGTDAVRGTPGLLLTGSSGVGKTSIVQMVTEELQSDPRTLTYTLYVDVSRHTERSVQTIKALMSFWLKKAIWHKPSILVLDNLDKLIPIETENSSFRTRHLAELFVAVFSASARSMPLNSQGVILLATATSVAALHPLVNGAHIFEDVVNLKPPNKAARKDILAHLVQQRLASAPDLAIDSVSPPNYTAISTQTEGYSASDLLDLVSRAVHQVAIRSAQQPLLTSKDFDAAQIDFTPLSLRNSNLQKSDVTWSDIGGLNEPRRVLRETLEWPTKYAAIFAQSPLRLRSGLLLYGYPGCGKTLLASAVARECGLNFISVKGPEILNKYIGASEQSVRELFERASAAKPCVLFFDEFDSIAPKRGHDSTGVTDRVVNQMLTQMDGAEGLDGVYVLAATSRPDLIDSALLRPGRLDKAVLCDMPSLEDRIDASTNLKVTLSPAVDLKEIALETDGYSGADLQALLYNAHLEVVHASIADTPASDRGPAENEDEESRVLFTVIGGPGPETTTKAEDVALQRRLRQIKRSYASKAQPEEKTKGTKSQSRQTFEIEPSHISRALKSTRPSVSPEEGARLKRIYQSFVSDRGGDMPVPPENDGIGNRVSLM